MWLNPAHSNPISLSLPLPLACAANEEDADEESFNPITHLHRESKGERERERERGVGMRWEMEATHCVTCYYFLGYLLPEPMNWCTCLMNRKETLHQTHFCIGDEARSTKNPLKRKQMRRMRAASHYFYLGVNLLFIPPTELSYVSLALLTFKLALFFVSLPTSQVAPVKLSHKWRIELCNCDWRRSTKSKKIYSLSLSLSFSLCLRSDETIWERWSSLLLSSEVLVKFHSLSIRPRGEKNAIVIASQGLMQWQSCKRMRMEREKGTSDF